MDFDSPDPDVEKEFPGLFASESGVHRKKDDDDFSDGDHEKVSKKELLLGRRKDKKDKKDRGYATLDGESSPEEDYETKSPSKLTKKSKTFKFSSSSKSKEKREKSREKDKCEKTRDKEKCEKVREKEKCEKEPKKKEKEKEKDKKSKQSSFNDEFMELGDAQPIFGVSLGLAVVRGHCHDNVNLPLVVRDCIDYLQENGLQTEQIYKVDVVKTKLQQLKRTYNNREMVADGEFDVPTACSLLKVFIRELPEPLLTTDLLPRFEEVATGPLASQPIVQQQELLLLINQLPGCNRTLLTWLLLHFDGVINAAVARGVNQSQKQQQQTLATLLGPTLQMSHRLLVTLLTHVTVLFPDTVLAKYKPPITSSSTSPNLPETPDEITEELKKQDSLLNQIHAEMNAGFVSKKREEQLWEVQRIITQLKRKLRSFERKHDSMQKSMDDAIGEGDTSLTYDHVQLTKTKSICSDDESLKTMTMVSTESNTETKTTPEVAAIGGGSIGCAAVTSSVALPSLGIQLDQQLRERILSTQTSHDDETNAIDRIVVNEDGLLVLPESHPDYLNLLRLQLENMELTQWKLQLQRRIQSERAEVVRLKTLLNNPTNSTNPLNTPTTNTSAPAIATATAVTVTTTPSTSTVTTIMPQSNNGHDGDGETIPDDGSYERIITQYVRENTLLEQKKQILAKEIFDENRELIQLQVELAIRKYQI